MKNFARQACYLLTILAIFNLAACRNQNMPDPSTVISPTSTSVPASFTPVANIAATNTVVPTATVIPFLESDEQNIKLKDGGYRLISSGSVVGPNGFIYSAYLFINPDLSPLFGASKTDGKAVLVAFYRWDGENNQFLEIQSIPMVNNNYAVGANLINWDQPFTEGLLLDVFVEADKATKSMLKQNNYSSDINLNGLPEFAFAVQYCPVSCTHPTGGIQLFEIQNPSTIKNITRDLPGLTLFKMHSKNPFTFYVVDSDFYDIYLEISSSWIYTWHGSNFVDVSSNYADKYLAEASSIINNLKSMYNKPFDIGGNASEMDVLKILKLYEKAGLSEQGLQLFLDITNISHWPNTTKLSQCWLQISRAMAQEDFKQDRKFELPYGSSYWEKNPHMTKTYEDTLKQAGYDVSACNSVTP